MYLHSQDKGLMISKNLVLFGEGKGGAKRRAIPESTLTTINVICEHCTLIQTMDNQF
jgi:hypothetical protein